MNREDKIVKLSELFHDLCLKEMGNDADGMLIALLIEVTFISMKTNVSLDKLQGLVKTIYNESGRSKGIPDKTLLN